jgi:hypothetical protein
LTPPTKYVSHNRCNGIGVEFQSERRNEWNKFVGNSLSFFPRTFITRDWASGDLIFKPHYFTPTGVVVKVRRKAITAPRPSIAMPTYGAGMTVARPAVCTAPTAAIATATAIVRQPFNILVLLL